MLRTSRFVPLFALVLLAGAAFAGGKAVVKPAADLAWTAAAVKEVSFAPVEGDMAKGPARFYLRYAAGFVTPLHHHSADHFVTTVAGNLVLVVDGREQRLAPGSYFAFTGGAPHLARCEGTADCVMFVDAKGAWDVVPEPAAK